MSDIFVARHRFVKKEIVNRFTGLPLYYTGQLLIAFSIGYLSAAFMLSVQSDMNGRLKFCWIRDTVKIEACKTWGMRRTLVRRNDAKLKHNEEIGRISNPA